MFNTIKRNKQERENKLNQQSHNLLEDFEEGGSIEFYKPHSTIANNVYSIEFYKPHSTIANDVYTISKI